MDETLLASVPIVEGRVTMRDLRDFVEATDDASEDDDVLVLPGELQYRAAR